MGIDAYTCRHAEMLPACKHQHTIFKFKKSKRSSLRKQLHAHKSTALQHRRE